MRYLIGIFAALLLACGGGSTHQPPSPPPEPPPGAALVEPVGAVPEHQIAGLAWTTRGVVVAAVQLARTPDDLTVTRLVRLTPGRDAEVLRTIDGEVVSLHAEGDGLLLLWATHTGAWRWQPGAEAPTPLPLPERISSAVPAGEGLLVGAQGIATLVDAAGRAEALSPSGVMYPGDLASSEAVLAWVDQQAVWARVGEGAPVLVRDELRRPHGLSADGAALIWAESEADLLPGRAAASFYAEHDGSQWQVRALPFSLWGGGHVLLDGMIYSAAACAAVDASDWTRFDLGGGMPPVAVGPERFYWVRWDHDAEQSRILSAPRSACR